MKSGVQRAKRIKSRALRREEEGKINKMKRITRMMIMIEDADVRVEGKT